MKKLFNVILYFSFMFIFFSMFSYSSIDAKVVTKIENAENGIQYKRKYYYDSNDVMYKKIVYISNYKKQYKTNRHGYAFRYLYTYKNKKNKTLVRHKYTNKGKLTNKGAKFYTYSNGKKYKFIMASKSYKLSYKYNPRRSKSTKAAYNKMIKQAKKDGVYFRQLSWYRSYSTQKSTWNYWVRLDGVKKAEMYSVRPGRSEHQTGLAIDLGSTTKPSTDFESSFEKTKEGKWLKKNAHKYGFTIRYPKGKSKITGYIYEPWHLRYMQGSYSNAKKHAKNLKNDKTTVEQYFGLKK